MTYKCSACGHTVTRQTPVIGTLYCNNKFCDIHGFPVKMEPIKEYKMTKEDELALEAKEIKMKHTLTNQELIDLIEPLVDDTNISAVLDALAEICTRKGNVIQCSGWLKTADIITQAAKKTTKIQRMDKTRQKTRQRSIH